MTLYAFIEIVTVTALVGACAFAMALRLLPTSWLKAPLGAWLDHAGRPKALRRVGARWRAHAKPGCANGCCAAGDGCAIGRNAAVPSRTAKRIPVTLLASDPDQARV